jgi:hypothetical protein
MIQGAFAARYEGRTQQEIIEVSNWNWPGWDICQFIEDFRINGEKALA